MGVLRELEVVGCYAMDEAKASTQMASQLYDAPPFTKEGVVLCTTNIGSDAAAQIAELVDEFPTLWRHSGTIVGMPEDRHIKISLVEGWEKE